MAYLRCSISIAHQPGRPSKVPSHPAKYGPRPAVCQGEGPMDTESEQKKKSDIRSPEKKTFDINHQKFFDALNYILDHGSTSQRREILGLIMDLNMQIIEREEDAMKK
jgi:hypothetical protein